MIAFGQMGLWTLVKPILLVLGFVVALRAIAFVVRGVKGR